MTDQSAWGGDLPEDPDTALAAEFVLRLLDPAEEAACAARIDRDPVFATLVARWRADFSSFDAEFAPVAPPAGLAARIEARLFGRPPPLLARLWNSAGLWRAVAAAAVVAAGYFAVSTTTPPSLVPGEAPARLISAVAAVDSDVQLLAFLDPRAEVLNVNRVSGAPAPGRALELWVLVEGDTAPVSLGVMPEAERFSVTLPPSVAGRVGPGTLIEVSQEGPEGSLTGRPTLPVLAKGSVSET